MDAMVTYFNIYTFNSQILEWANIKLSFKQCNIYSLQITWKRFKAVYLYYRKSKKKILFDITMIMSSRKRQFFKRN